MKILYVLGREPGGGMKKIMEEHRRHNDVAVVDLRERKDSYEKLVDLIAASDRVISV
jgi:hypothetical protein